MERMTVTSRVLSHKWEFIPLLFQGAGTILEEVVQRLQRLEVREDWAWWKHCTYKFIAGQAHKIKPVLGLIWEQEERRGGGKSTLYRANCKTFYWTHKIKIYTLHFHNLKHPELWWFSYKRSPQVGLRKVHVHVSSLDNKEEMWLSLVSDHFQC